MGKDKANLSVEDLVNQAVKSEAEAINAEAQEESAEAHQPTANAEPVQLIAEPAPAPRRFILTKGSSEPCMVVGRTKEEALAVFGQILGLSNLEGVQIEES